MQKLTPKMKWAAVVAVGIFLSFAAVELGSVPLRAFNEMVIRPAAVLGNLAIRVPRAFFYGFDYAAVTAGANAVIAALIAGLISAAVLSGLFKMVVWAVRKLRMNEPAHLATRSGDVAYWFGCMLGVYFLCSVILVTISFGIATFFTGAIGLVFWTAVLCWSIGYSVRYMLGRSSLNL